MSSASHRDKSTIGVIGAGNMGSALVKGWVRSSVPGLRLVVWDKVGSAVERLLTSELVSPAASLEDLVERADMVVVVVKPKDATEVLSQLGRSAREGQVVVSAMAGVTLASMRGDLGSRPALVRVMPNLGVALGAGAVAVAAEAATPEAAIREVTGLLEPLGLVEVVSEDAVDTVTAVSGSGPAFLAIAIESLEDGAVAAGLPRAVARALVRRAALEAADLLRAHSDSAGELRADLREAGRIDDADLAPLRERGIAKAFEQAVAAALERSRKLRAAK